MRFVYIWTLLIGGGLVFLLVRYRQMLAQLEDERRRHDVAVREHHDIVSALRTTQSRDAMVLENIDEIIRAAEQAVDEVRSGKADGDDPMVEVVDEVALSTKLAEAEAEITALKDKWLRSLADLENYVLARAAARRAAALGHGAPRPLHARAFRLGGFPRRAR